MTPDVTTKNLKNLDTAGLTSHESQEIDRLINSTLKKPEIKLTSNDMEDFIHIKLEKQAKGRGNRLLFTSIGFTISLLIVISAFEWKSYDDKELIDLTYTGSKFEEIAEIPLTEQPPPPPPASKTVQVIFNEVPDEEILEEIKVDLDVEITSEMSISEETYNPIPFEPEEETPEEIFTIVEFYPQPVGGYEAFYKHIGENLYYPLAARKADIEGKVFVQFVVEANGAISNVVVVKGIGMGCDEAAVKAVQASPKWVPGKQRGNPVRVRMILPIIFKMAKEF